MQDRYEKLVDREIEKQKLKGLKKINGALSVRFRDREEQKKLDAVRRQEEHDRNVYLNAEHEMRISPITEVPPDVVIPPDYFSEVEHRVEYNEFYSDYYWQLYEDTNLKHYADLSERVRNCHKSWFGDHYKKSGYFNVKHVFHCHNRWCSLCNHLKQAKRLYYYTLLFEELRKEYDLYHVVFTLRNCELDVLKDTLERMQGAIKSIFRYFQGHKKISGLDFAQYGLVGGLRSFEIVINPTDFHPHLHCLFLMKKGLDFPKTIINKFSFRDGIKSPVRYFSEFEVMLQKIFYLLVNGQLFPTDKKEEKNKYKVTKENIDNLSLGYSCTADCVEGDAWHEVFKYATKMSKDGAAVCSYKQFAVLDNILRRMKMIQGYGILYDIDKKQDDIDPMVEILFEKVIILLNRMETPEYEFHFKLSQLVEDVKNKKTTVISKKLAYKYLQTYYDELRKEYPEDENYTDPF